MKSIKPGRGPSMMSGVMGIFMILFGVFWTVLAAGMGAGIMVPFGLIFIGVAVAQVIYNFKNATGKNRYSAFDITEENEEPDPFNQRFGQQYNYDSQYDAYNAPEGDRDSEFCPYCGNAVDNDFEYCNKCGRKLP